MDLSSDRFIKTFLIQYFDYFSKDSKRKSVSASLCSEIHDLSIGHVNIITYGKLSGDALNILSSVYCMMGTKGFVIYLFKMGYTLSSLAPLIIATVQIKTSHPYFL